MLFTKEHGRPDQLRHLTVAVSRYLCSVFVDVEALIRGGDCPFAGAELGEEDLAAVPILYHSLSLLKNISSQNQSQIAVSDAGRQFHFKRSAIGDVTASPHVYAHIHI